MAQYVIDLIRGRAAPPSDSRHFLADTDAEAIEAADAISFGEIAGDPHVTGYRLRAPGRNSDRIVHEGFRERSLNGWDL
jgi:hypothetical protein